MPPFPEQMGIAQGMVCRQLNKRAPRFVNHGALKLGQDIHVLQGRVPSLLVIPVQGELQAAHNMDPGQLSIHFAPCLIRVENGLI